MPPEMEAARILLVEDDASARESICELLAHRGYEVQTAGDGRDALNHLFDERQPDLMILDMKLPVMDGRQLLAVTRAYHRLASIPVLVLSAYAVPPIDPDSVAVVMRKPFDPEDLLVNVAALARRDRKGAGAHGDSSRGG